MDGLMPRVSSDAKAAGWLVGWSGASVPRYHYCLPRLPLFCIVFVLTVCIRGDSGVTVNIQVYKSEWSCHRGYSIPVEAVSCVPCEYIHHMSCPTVDELVRESIKAGYTYIEMTTTT